MWTIISGKGMIVLDGIEKPVGAGDVFTLQIGVKHTILAKTELKLIEVQLGREISIYDKKVYNYKI